MTKMEMARKCLVPLVEPLSGAIKTYRSCHGRSACFGCRACHLMEPLERKLLPFGLYLWEYLTKLGF